MECHREEVGRDRQEEIDVNRFNLLQVQSKKGVGGTDTRRRQVGKDVLGKVAAGVVAWIARCRGSIYGREEGEVRI